MLYPVLGTFFTFGYFGYFPFLGRGPPKYLNLATCCIFFFFLKPSDRISLPLLAQVRFFFFLVGEGIEQVVGNGTVRLNYHYKMIVPDLSFAYSCFSGQVCTVCSAVYMVEFRL